MMIFVVNIFVQKYQTPADTVGAFFNYPFDKYKLNQETGSSCYLA